MILYKYRLSVNNIFIILLYNIYIINNISELMIRHYFLIATRDFFLYQEPIEEILRERIRHYNNLEKDIDFCLTANLSFLNSPDLRIIEKQLIKPSVAIVSLNPKFIDWLKLRTNYAIKGSFMSSRLQMNNSLVTIDDYNS
jgi:hypothetical protein